MQITNRLKLVEFKVDYSKVVENATNIHHIWLLDRSGSMKNILKDVISDLKKQCRKLSPGDALSFGWFSSNGQYAFPIKIFRISDDSNCFLELSKLFDECNTASGTANFSDILKETIKLTKESDFLSMPKSVVFFSDGKAEDTEEVRKILPELNENIDSFISIAHGNYADYEFLFEMAEACGGESVRSSNLEQVTSLIDKWLRATKKLQPSRFTIDISSIKDKKVLGLFSLLKDNVNTYRLNKDYLINCGSNLYAIIEEPSRGITQLNEPFLYAIALVLTRKGRVNDALEVLGVLGDKKLIDDLNNSFVPSERGRIEDKIKQCIFDMDARFSEGRVEKYLPDENVFSVFDFIEYVTQREDIKFYSNHPDFQYSSIGRKGKIPENYPRFIPNADEGSHFLGMMFNQKYMNISILSKINGTIDLPESFDYVQKDGSLITLEKPEHISTPMSVHQFRNFNIIKDGFLNMEKIPISGNIESIEFLMSKGVIAKDKPNEKRIYIANLKNIPVVNRNIGRLEIKAKDLLTNFLAELELKARQKVIKSLKDEINPELPRKLEKDDYMDALCINDDGLYSPPFILDPPTDTTWVTAFILSVKGLSTFPTIKAIKEKIENNAKLTPSIKMMHSHLEEIENALEGLSKDEKLTRLEDFLSITKKQLIDVRMNIQKIKFSLVLGKNWFSDLENLDAETIIELEGGFIGTIKIEKHAIEL